jgi:hypothetical protein
VLDTLIVDVELQIGESKEEGELITCVSFGGLCRHTNCSMHRLLGDGNFSFFGKNG